MRVQGCAKDQTTKCTQNSFKGRGFQPQLNETDDEVTETEPVASNVRSVRRFTSVKPAPEVLQSLRKLQAAQKASRKNIPQKVGRGTGTAAFETVRYSTAPKVGRRTGAAAFEGKKIRLLPDGTENFDDYFTDSEAEMSSSRESVLKENNFRFNKPSNVVRRELSMSPKKVAETVRYSTKPKIGRRTGSAAFEGKKIRLLPDGTENFDDYFTDDSTSKDSYNLTEPSVKKLSIRLEESSAITDEEDSDRIMIHKSCDTRDLAVPTSSSKSKQLREHSAREERTEQHYKAKHTYLISPRRNLLASNLGNLSGEAEACLVSNRTKSKRNKSINVYNEELSTRNIAEAGALVSTDDEAPLISAGDAVEAIHLPKATRNNKKKDGKSTDKQRPSISNIDEIDNEADAKKVKKSYKKKQKDKLPSTEGVRRGTRIRIPPLETWRGQRQVFKYKSGKGFVYTNISPGRKEDDACRQAILKRMQEQKEMKIKEKKKGKSRRIPKTTVFDASREKEVSVHLHRPFDFVEWTAITVAEGGKVPYYLTKTFASDNVTFGFLEICPLEMKASQYSPEDNIHFLVVKGSLKVMISKSEFMFERLDTFIVPCKEVYSIENVGKTKALLSFCTFKTPFFPHQ